MTTLDDEAADPQTPGARLADLAYTHPELRAAIARNPATYPALREWLRQFDDSAAGGEAAAVDADTRSRPKVSALSADLSGAELHRLATERPDLRAQIRVHPNCYPELATWIDATAERDRAVVGATSVPTAAALEAWRDRPDATATPGPSSAEPARPARRSPSAWILRTGPGRAVLVAVIALAIIGIAAAAFGIAGAGSRAPAASHRHGSSAAGSDGSSSTGSSSPSPATTPSPSATSASRIPGSCGDLWSTGYAAQLQSQGYSLGSGTGASPDDSTEQTVLANVSQSIQCSWSKADGSSTLDTTVMTVSDSDTATLTQRFGARGMRTGADSHGTRYFIDSASGGESDLIVSGIWFCTTWSGTGPVGYTQDMSTRMFG